MTTSRWLAVIGVLGLSLARDGGSTMLLAATPSTTTPPMPATTAASVVAATTAVDAVEIGSSTTRCEIRPREGKIVITAEDGTQREFDASIVLPDGTERTFGGETASIVRRGPNAVSLAPADKGKGGVDIRFDPAKSELLVELAADADANANAEPDAGDVALRLATAVRPATLFVPGHGEVDDIVELTATTAVLDDASHPLAVVAPSGFSLALLSPESTEQSAAVYLPRAAFTVGATAGTTATLRVVVGASSQRVWGAAFANDVTQKMGTISGVVSGTTERARVVGVDESGHPVVRCWTEQGGHFSVVAPLSAVRWYAMLDSASASAPVPHTPGANGDVRLEIKPGGKVQVHVVDPDAPGAPAPLVSRLIIRGRDGTPDPILRGDFRGVAAGPIIDLRTGEATVALPAGRYRIAATRGIEWSIDSADVEIANGHTAQLHLEPRHVVATPSLIGCDLHVHARPSFDSLVTPEDRVLSLVSAGVDFAVPTEHNRIGDYTNAIATQHLNADGAPPLAWVRGVEVTTESPGFGHFGVFPIPPNANPPPYRATSVGSIFAAARRGNPSATIVVHHPRMPAALGYLEAIAFEAKSKRIPAAMRTDFDVLEVYSGKEMHNRDKVERVLDDWFALLNLGKRYAASGSSDSHKLQFQWAGYPRTYARIDQPTQNGETGAPINTASVLAAVKTGHGFVTSGPIITFDAQGAGPGDELKLKGDSSNGTNNNHVTAFLKVDAAPWIDVSSIEVVANGTSIFRKDIAKREAYVGRETGSIEEATERTLRFGSFVELTIPPTASWIVVVVRGERSFGSILPFMPVQPMAFTNPMWIVR